MNRNHNYDPLCLELARHFLPDTADCDEQTTLAQVIQDAVDAHRSRKGKQARTVWHQATARPLMRIDTGMWIVAKDLFGTQMLGEIAIDGFGIVIRSTEGHDMRRRPIEQIAQYTLLDPPGR